MKPFYILIITALMGLLTACIAGVGQDPALETTELDPALKEIILDETVAIHQARLSSIHFHQTAKNGDSIYTLVSYQSAGDDTSSCVAIYEGQLVLSDWQTTGSSATCQGDLPAGETAAIVDGLYIHKGDLYAYGVAHNPAARWVEITWTDKVVQRVPVINSSYLATRPDQETHNMLGILMPTEIQVFNALGLEIASNSN